MSKRKTLFFGCLPLSRKLPGAEILIECLSHTMCHVPHVTTHVWPVTCPFFFLNIFNKKKLSFKNVDHVVELAEFLATPKFWVWLLIRSNWAKHSECTTKSGAPRLGHHFCSLNDWKILSSSLDTTQWRCFQKTLSAKTNFVQHVVQNYRWHNSTFNFQVNLETKILIL